MSIQVYVYLYNACIGIELGEYFWRQIPWGLCVVLSPCAGLVPPQGRAKFSGTLNSVMTQLSANHVNPDLPGTALPLFHCVDSPVYPVIYYYIVLCV